MTNQKLTSILSNNFLIRLGVAIILLVHGLGGMFNNGVNNFGNLYLNQVGFAPFGLVLAWAIKISHVVCAVSLLLNRYVVATASITIFILITGIIMIHSKEGWFVVGGGRNGVEFNFILILILTQLIYNKYNQTSQR
jgi:putative oxidoreductase